MGKSNSPAIAEHVSRKALGRKATLKSEATRKQILDAAATIFAEKGYSLTRLSDIAQASGIHLTGLYYYYDNKEELVSDIICHAPSRAANGLKEALSALPADVGHRRRIEVAIEVYVKYILATDDYARADHRVASQISPEVRQRALSIAREINDIWRQLLDDAAKAGEIRSDLDMTMLRMLMLGSMNWTIEWFRPEQGPPTKLIEVMKALFFDGAVPRD